MPITPIKFIPIFKERIWGSDRLKSLYQKKLPHEKIIGESWELVDLPDDQSVVADGKFYGMNIRNLLEEQGPAIGFTPDQTKFPFGLMVKFLDTDQALSVQVHPDETACRQFTHAQPKSECWYVLHAQPNAVIYRGLKPSVTIDLVQKAIEDKTIQNLLEVYPAKTGDFHFLPAGTIHALGAGITVAEIQTPSDTTFRLYDWDRKDKNGQSRLLHVEQALASIHYTDKPNNNDKNTHTGNAIAIKLATAAKQIGIVRRLIDCPHFSVIHVRTADKPKIAVKTPFPVIIIVLSGMGKIGPKTNDRPYQPGDTILLPTMDEGWFYQDSPGEFLMCCLGPIR